ncbi:restriction endonuclease subunit S [Bernardetia sp. ABR2-2B]|uniref:restriction endonuclease subunit S n=1 Tax=Bernardetia sp. ABR2-2B TaxID=3127472 RepID=UPI0030CCBD8E
MEKVKKNIPTLRFPQFEGKWETKKIGQILQIGSGKDFKHLKKGNIPVFGTGGLMDKVDTALYTGETVFIGRKGTIDKPVYFNGSFWTVDTLFYTYDFNLSYPKFVYALFQRINWYAHNEASGVPSLSKTTINSLKINLPSLSEQQKIANFLTTTDKRIELLTKKKELCQQYKKAMMQKLFSQELRFKDENGKNFPKWETKKLREITESLSSGKTKPQNEGSINVYGSMGIIGKCIDATHKGEYILIARVGANAGTLFVINDEFSVTDNTLILKLNERSILKFIAYSLDKLNLNKLVFGSGQPLITAGQLKQLKINLPSLQEQKKIAGFLTALDKKVELVEKQIQFSEQFKKYLLQNLFV